MIKYGIIPILTIVFLAIYLCVAIPHVILGSIRNLMDLAIDKLIEWTEPDV